MELFAVTWILTKRTCNTDKNDMDKTQGVVVIVAVVILTTDLMSIITL